MAGGELNLTADKRTPFWPDSIDFEGDWAGLALAMHIRIAPGATGSPLVALATSTSPAEGLSWGTPFVWDGGGEVYVDGQTYTPLFIRINESTLEALSLGSPAHEPLVLYYDLHVGSSTAKKRRLYGTFTIDPGVTI